MALRPKRLFWISLVIITVASSVVCIAGYIGNGIAYGDLYGIRGSKQALRAMQSRSWLFLALGSMSQILAIAFTATLPQWKEAQVSGSTRIVVSAFFCPAITALLFFVFVWFAGIGHI